MKLYKKADAFGQMFILATADDLLEAAREIEREQAATVDAQVKARRDYLEAVLETPFPVSTVTRNLYDLTKRVEKLEGKS